MNGQINETRRNSGEWLPCFNADIHEFKRELQRYIDSAAECDTAARNKVPVGMDGKFSAYPGNLVYFHHETPAAGREYIVAVSRPFYEEAGMDFRAVYAENPASPWEILDCTMLKVTYPADGDIPAEAVVRVNAVYGPRDIIRKADDVSCKKPVCAGAAGLSEAEIFRKYDMVRWKWLDDGVRVVSSDIEDAGMNGDGEGILDEAMIFTDEDGTDHLIASRHNGNICFGDILLGRHSVRKAMLCREMLKNSMVYAAGWNCAEGRAEINAIWGETEYARSDLVLISADIKGKLVDLSRMLEDGDEWYCIGDDAFVSEDTEEIVLSTCIQAIGENAFSRCPELRKVTVPDGCQLWPESIALNAFTGCCKDLTFSLPKNSPLTARLKLMGHSVTERE